MALTFLYAYNLPDNNLHIIACDVGQGDATLIIHKDTQILIDGGPGKKVLECLSSNVQFTDREIELVVITHPQKDHYEGIISVLQNYSVGKILKTELTSSSQDYQVLENRIKASGTQIVNASNTQRVGLDLIHLDILHPSSNYLAEVLGVSTSDLAELDVSSRKSFDPNQASVVLHLNYGEFDGLFTGDIGVRESGLIADKLRGMNIDFEYIKVPHHGSRNGISEILLRVSSPEIATISSSRNNSYGHPHKEVLDLLTKLEIQYYRTDTDGEVEIVSDGKKFWVEK